MCQGRFAVSGQGNDWCLTLFCQIQNFQDFLGFSGHGDQNSHILRSHGGSVGELDVVVSTEIGIFVNSHQLGLQILANDSRSADTKNPNGSGVGDCTGSFFQRIGIQQFRSILHGLNAVLLDSFNQHLHTDNFPNIRERSGGAFVRWFLHLRKQCVFHHR